jgi:hypothetical protein
VIVRSTIFEQVEVLGFRPPYYFLFNGLLCWLLCLHVYWSWMIMRIVRLHLATGSPRDVREDER